MVTEACTPVIRYMMERSDIYRVEAAHDIDNPASGKVMQKLGVQFEGIVRRYMIHPNISDAPRDCKLWSIVK